MSAIQLLRKASELVSQAKRLIDQDQQSKRPRDKRRIDQDQQSNRPRAKRLIDQDQQSKRQRLDQKLSESQDSSNDEETEFFDQLPSGLLTFEDLQLRSFVPLSPKGVAVNGIYGPQAYVIAKVLSLDTETNRAFVRTFEPLPGPHRLHRKSKTEWINLADRWLCQRLEVQKLEDGVVQVICAGELDDLECGQFIAAVMVTEDCPQGEVCLYHLIDHTPFLRVGHLLQRVKPFGNKLHAAYAGQFRLSSPAILDRIEAGAIIDCNVPLQQQDNVWHLDSVSSDRLFDILQLFQSNKALRSLPPCTAQVNLDVGSFVQVFSTEPEPELWYARIVESTVRVGTADVPLACILGDQDLSTLANGELISWRENGKLYSGTITAGVTLAWLKPVGNEFHEQGYRYGPSIDTILRNVSFDQLPSNGKSQDLHCANKKTNHATQKKSVLSCKHNERCVLAQISNGTPQV